MKRGVVIAGLCNTTVNGSETTIESQMLDPCLLRSAVLYWDRIDIPDNDFLSYSLDKELNVLEQEGILTRKMISLGFGMGLAKMGAGSTLTLQHDSIQMNGQIVDPKVIVNKAPVVAFAELLKEEDILWSYYKISDSVELPFNTLPSRTFFAEIKDALPVPKEDVSYEEILEFKAKRKDEYDQLLTEIDDIYQRINNSADLEHAKLIETQKIKRAIHDLIACSEENFGQVLKRSLRFEINPVQMAAAIAALTQSIPVGTLVGLSSCVSFNFSELFSGKNHQNSPYQYILSANKENIAKAA